VTSSAPRRAVALAAAGLATLVFGGGCGGRSDAQQVRDTVAAYRTAIERHDWSRLCRDVFATRLRVLLEQHGVECVRVVPLLVGGVVHPTLAVRAISVKGSDARVQVSSGAAGEPPADVVVDLVRESGSWRIAALGGDGPPVPPPLRAP
jgi:hypothetical protein